MEDLELYTIPSYSSWFAWDNIHEVERFSLREFFDGSSVTRSPRIYKEYRDFIISKYREDPSRKLTFTEVRKSLVGDVSVLLKVFTFLEKWGLINFNATDKDDKIGDGNGGVRTALSGRDEEEEDWRGRVKVEEGAPHGVRVVAAPNSMKPILAPPPPPSVAVDGGGVVGEVGESGFKWPPLASYSDIYGELMRPDKNKGLVCGSCKDECDSTHYEYTKEGSFILCAKCFKSGNYEKDKLAVDFKLKDSVNQVGIWTEAETSLLLESVLKHGEDWDLVAMNVQTKNKLECISKLIQLPFGDLMLGAGYRKGRYLDVIADISDSKQAKLASNDNDPQNGDDENEGPPLKRVCTDLTPDIGCSLMKEVALISTMLGPHVTAFAAEAAVTSLCYENQCSIEIFDDDDGKYVDSESSPETHNQKRYSSTQMSYLTSYYMYLNAKFGSIYLLISATDVDDAVEDERPNQSGANSYFLGYLQNLPLRFCLVITKKHLFF
ncbi:swi/snf complex subunit swi3a [Phtheirospermum japonicum]|uniref:Swi/snf complex subunit swi3a n=1 Tax=Phtheirospermum japonicum TaxID=374723 RepID=A0A830B8J6_9LAMI|nr:swi/snf complex subunit swi3a [Phtheirospermum japonicum]